MNRKWNAGVLAMAAAALCSPCLGQYQKNYQINPGQVLDHNPQAGSGGYNGPGGGAVNAYGNMARDSSLSVTGNTTGLSAFRGSLPYISSDQFQIGLPSASLSTFQRQSVGLPDVMAGNTLGAVPYFDRATSILKAPAIVGGYASPGTNAPLVPTVDISVRATLTSKVYVDAFADYKAVLPNAAGRGLSVPIQEVAISPFLPATVEGVTTGTAPPELVRFLEGAVAGQGMLLNILDERGRSTLGQQLYDMQHPHKPGEANAAQSLGTKVWTEPNYALHQMDANSWLVNANTTARPGEANALLMPPRENMDVFMDLIERMRQRREGMGGAAALPGVPGRPIGPPSETRPLLVEVTPESQIIIHSLAGRGRDLSNRDLTEAETKLKGGKFYEAAEAYAMAAQLNLRNPLPHVGRGLALLGAGEPASAAGELRAALEVFPPLIEARMELGDLMGLAVLRSRLAELDARLERPEADADPMLPFLACYLHYNLGELESAKLYAKQVREGAAKSKVVKVFAEFVLTGKRPSAQTQPADVPLVAPDQTIGVPPPPEP